MKVRAAVIASIFVWLVACGSGEEGDQAAEPTPGPTQSATPCLVEDASTETRTSDTEPPFAPVTDVRYNTGDCPRVVFEFRNQIPSYEIGYVDPPLTECGSGDEVASDAWDAESFISVRLEPSASVDLAAEAEPTYEGSRDIDADGDVLRHLRVVCDFEAVFEWIVALDDTHPFSVVTFDDPPRIMIDVSSAESAR